MYYAYIENDKIIGVGQYLCTDKKTVEITKEVFEDIEKYIWDGSDIILNPNWEQEHLEILKQEKYEENDTKAKEARYSQEFTITIQEQECTFDTTEQTQRDLLTAFAVCSTGQTYNDWVTNNGVTLNLTMDDVSLIAQVFKEKSNVYDKWNLYKQEIDEAQTEEELNAIEIVYNMNKINS